MPDNADNGKTVYIGIDSTNSGRHPEVYVAVFSEFASDVIVKNHGRNMRASGFYLEQMLSQRDYRYLMIENPAKYEYKEIIAKTSSLMINDFIKDKSSSLEIYIDGFLLSEQKDDVKNKTSILCNIPKESIQVYDVVKGKKKHGNTNELIFLADGKARWYLNFIWQHRISKLRNLEKRVSFG